MFLTLLVEALLGGTAEALAAAGMEKTPQIAQRIQRALALVESQTPTALEAAIERAVAGARADLLADYREQIYSGDPDPVAAEMIALLNHPPFAEEVAHKLLYRGQPDFERLAHFYLAQPGTQRSERWAALEFPLIGFFDAIENHLKMDKAVGGLVQGIQQVTTLTRLAGSSQRVAETSQQIQAYQQRIAAAGEETAGGIRQLIAQSQEQIRTLADVAAFLREAGTVHTGGGSVFQQSVAVGGDFINRGKISYYYSIYQQPSGRARLDEDQFQRILQEYLDWTDRAYGRARLYGLESVRTARGRPVRSLADVFVPISLRRFAPPSRRDVEKMAQTFGADPLAEHKAFLALADEGKQSGKPVEVANLLTTHNRLAVIGGAGCGKSTLLTWLAFSLAHNAQHSAIRLGSALPFRLPPDSQTPIPLLIPLRYYRQYQEACRTAPGRRLDHPRSGTLAGFIPWYLKQRSPALELSEDFFDRLLLGGGCTLLLDGLDEIVDQTERGRVRAQVEALANDIYPKNHFIVTAREAGYRENAVFGDDFVRLDVQPLDEAQIRALVGNWCEQLYPGEVETQTDAIEEAIATINERYRRQQIKALVDTPLMTTMVISVKWGETELPRERSKLYEAAVKVILQAQYLDEDESREALINWGGPWEEQREWLSHLALSMHSRGEAGANLDESSVRAILQAQLTGEQLDSFLRAVLLRGGLLEERAAFFQFIHLTFQEFLAARLLAKEREESWSALLPHVTDGWWREVFLLHYGFAKTDFAPYAQKFLHWLSDLPAVDAATRLAGLELAGAAVLDIERPEPELRKRQAEALAAGLVDLARQTTPEQRLAAGKALAQLGDPRPGVGVVRARTIVPVQNSVPLPDIAWVKIPKIGADGQREFIYQEEKQESPDDFWMARYPITYAQFQTFIDALDGWRNPHWWEGLSVSDAQREKPDNQNYPYWNHPRENVSWYQAIAFCRWLTEQARQHPALLPAEARDKKDWRITLPTEWQWEKAARGHDGRQYPWGSNEYRPGYANIDERTNDTGPHYLQSTSAVGLYPQGASPYGLLDLSGNVWEWCLNEYDNPGNIQTSGSETRVLRGGSWSSYHNYAAAVRRNWYNPDLRWSYSGFRVVWSASVPATSGL